MIQGDEAAVDPGPGARVADLGVDGVGEVHGGRSLRELDDVAPRREDEHLAGEQVEAEGVEELVVVLGLAQLEHPPHPRRLLVARPLVPLRVLLVPPVRGDAPLRHPVHLPGAHLDLERLALGADDGGVQRLVQIELGHRDVVLEAAGHRLPQRVDGTERGVAVPLALDDDADPDEVEDLVELAAPADHLFVDGVEVLRAPRHQPAHPDLPEARLHLVDHALQVDLALGLALGHHLLDLLVGLGVQRLERQVLQLGADGLHAEAVGERGVDLEGLGGDVLPLGGRQRGERPHVVEAVGELDDEDPQVLGHRHDHLAEVLGPLLLLGAELDLVELGESVDDEGDLGAERALDVLELDVGVLDGVVQQGTDDGRRIHAQPGEDAGDADRVLDEQLPRFAELPLVGDLGELEGPHHLPHVGLRVMDLHLPNDVLDLFGGRANPQTREHGLDPLAAARGVPELPQLAAPEGRRLRRCGRLRRGGEQDGGQGLGGLPGLLSLDLGALPGPGLGDRPGPGVRAGGGVPVEDGLHLGRRARGPV